MRRSSPLLAIRETGTGRCLGLSIRKYQPGRAARHLITATISPKDPTLTVSLRTRSLFRLVVGEELGQNNLVLHHRFCMTSFYFQRVSARSDVTRCGNSKFNRVSQVTNDEVLDVIMRKQSARLEGRPFADDRDFARASDVAGGERAASMVDKQRAKLEADAIGGLTNHQPELGTREAGDGANAAWCD